ncbi:class I SAM-dependent methyltransferase [Paenibacillus sp. BAC0078]
MIAEWKDRIYSMLPFSASLTDTIIGQIPWHQVNTMAELGAGTGKLTKHIQAAKPDHTQVLLFEKNPLRRNKLRASYPGFLFFPDSLRLKLALHNSSMKRLDCIVSGLPFASYTRVMQVRLMEQIAASLRDGGIFIAYRYPPRLTWLIRQVFHLEQIKFVPFHCPPSFVYICRKKAAALGPKSGLPSFAGHSLDF